MTSRFILLSDRIRDNAINAIRNAPDGHTVRVGPPNRSLDQNAHFHALCSDLAKSHVEWFGKRRSLEEWKVLLVSGHTKATDGEVDIIPGLEGEMVNVRESTSKMSVSRASSLIEYTLAFCVSNSVDLADTRRGGFMEREAA